MMDGFSRFKQAGSQNLFNKHLAFFAVILLTAAESSKASCQSSKSTSLIRPVTRRPRQLLIQTAVKSPSETVSFLPNPTHSSQTSRSSTSPKQDGHPPTIIRFDILFSGWVFDECLELHRTNAGFRPCCPEARKIIFQLDPHVFHLRRVALFG